MALGDRDFAENVSYPSPLSRLLWAAGLATRGRWVLRAVASGNSRPLLPLPGLINSDRSMQIVARLAAHRLGPDVVREVTTIAAPLPVPVTAIWSVSDGLVNARACYRSGEPA